MKKTTAPKARTAAEIAEDLEKRGRAMLDAAKLLRGGKRKYERKTPVKPS